MHGGKREGAGAPKKPTEEKKVGRSFSIAYELDEFINKYVKDHPGTTKTEVIELALKKLRKSGG